MGKKQWGSAALLCLTASAMAQTVEMPSEYRKQIQSRTEIGMLDTDLFGERVDLYGGGLSILQTDLDIPGNNTLPVRIARRFTSGQADDAGRGLFADWDLDIPNIRGVFSQSGGWTVPGTVITKHHRCSRFAAPPAMIGTGGGTFEAEEYWQGTFLHLPDGSAQELMARTESNTHYPAGNTSYPIVTKSGTAIRCLSALDTISEQGSAGEGFEAVATDGTTYRFDHMVVRPHSSLQKPHESPIIASARAPLNYILHRKEYLLYPSRITDRFGNVLNYTWNKHNPGQLMEISADDGRKITLAYSDASARVISSISDGTRTWQYSYQPYGMVMNQLTSVTQVQSNETWLLAMGGLALARVNYGNTTPDCDWMGTDDGTYSGTMTHPGGARVEFSTQTISLGRSWQSRQCYGGDPTIPYTGALAIYPYQYQVPAIAKKKIFGPGLPISGMTWQFTYGPPNHCWHPDTVPAGAPATAIRCTSNSPTTRQVSVTDPSGNVTRYTFGNRVLVNEGQLLKTETGVSGNTALSTTTNTYADTSSASAYDGFSGFSFRSRGDSGIANGQRPVRRVDIQQQGATFTWQVETGCDGYAHCFDEYARPTLVTRSSSLGATRTERTAYHDNRSKWVLGQVSSITCSAAPGCSPEIVTNETVFDTSTALPLTIRSFGKLRQTRTYNADGTLSTVTDGNNNSTRLFNWKRGVPQSITYPDGKTQAAIVNSNGWITRITDENGYATNYTYDTMGRLTGITYPANDSIAWNTTTQNFVPVNSTEYGIPQGHWRQTTATGNGRKVVYFDALWRPLIVREYDTTNATSTQRFQRFSYDHEGRVSFASHPSASSNANSGIWSEYDALGRLTSITQDSEQGPLKTSFGYLSGFKTLTTDPEGNKTTTRYQAHDQPTTDWPVQIAHPNGAYTHVIRDGFGKPTRIRRSNSSSPTSGSLHVDRDYSYNSNQELCRIVEPETGTTLLGYDSSGNLKWSAAGLPAGTACNAAGTTPVIAQRRVDRAYDTRNHLTKLNFPDGQGDQVLAYTPDGLLASVSASNSGFNDMTVTTYSYNKRRLLTTETLNRGDGVRWDIGYSYDANGHLDSHTYPNGLVASYAPNALGQPTQANNYASAASYHPNGALKQFTYGNGIAHSLIQNERGLPAQITDCTATGMCPSANRRLDLTYSYDANGNIVAIADGAPLNKQSRAMNYDTTDRLIQSSSSVFGTANYDYDVLDNLVHVQVSGGNQARDQHYCYDSSNHLSEIKTGSCSGTTITTLNHDLQGNLANKDGQGYQFDYGNRLRSVSGVASFDYDGHGRRVRDKTTASKYSMYARDGRLMYVADTRQASDITYIYLSRNLIARVSETAAPASPVLTTPGFNNNGSYSVSWSVSAMADKYELQEAFSTGTWLGVYTGTGTSRTFSDKQAGNYRYRVRACLNGNCSIWSDTGDVAVQFAPDTAPILTAPATAAEGNYSIEWSNVGTAATYTLEERTNGGVWTAIYNGPNRERTYSGRAAGSYGYRVKPCNPAGCGPYSNVKTVQAVYKPTTPPTVTAPTTSKTGSYSIAWNSVATATSYQLDERINSGSWIRIHDAPGNSKTVSGKGNGKYSYRVRACNAAGCGGYSAAVSTEVTLAPTTAPTVTAPLTNTTGSYTVSWSSVAGATSYKVDERTNGGAWTQIHDAAGTAKAISGKPSGTYDYRARGCNTGGCGPLSALASVQRLPNPPAIPSLLEGEADRSLYPLVEFYIHWSAVSGATHYELQQQRGSSPTTIVYNGPGRQYSTMESQKTSHKYWVRACNAGGCSGWKGPIQVYTQ